MVKAWNINSILDLANEYWSFIPNTHCLYQVSNLGRVKSLYRMDGFLPTGIEFVRSPKIIKQTKNRDGYLLVGIIFDHGKKTVSVHKLIGISFIPNPLRYTELNHINSNKTDNRVENLQWCTRGQNISEAYRKGLMCVKGRGNPNRKLTEGQVMEIFNSGESNINLSKKYNVTSSTIGDIKRGTKWSHLTGKTYIRQRNHKKSYE